MHFGVQAEGNDKRSQHKEWHAQKGIVKGILQGYPEVAVGDHALKICQTDPGRGCHCAIVGKGKIERGHHWARCKNNKANEPRQDEEIAFYIILHPLPCPSTGLADDCHLCLSSLFALLC